MAGKMWMDPPVWEWSVPLHSRGEEWTSQTEHRCAQRAAKRKQICYALYRHYVL
ncbi:MAG: hypothetical protein LBK73_02750 [Treponema sp.]|nr:hypothetical protein [Treponema sp.]